MAGSSDPSPDVPTVGVLGGGQLGRMLGLAALRMGLRVRFYREPDSGSGPTDGVAEARTGAIDDADALRDFVRGCRVITLDNEWLPLDPLLEQLPPDVSLWPSPQTMALVRDKIEQKRHACAHDLPVGPHRACASEEDLREAAEAFGYPMVVKQPRHSYDGYGNATVRNWDELQAAFERLGAGRGRVLVEAYVDFVRELAVMVARRPGGEDVVYPVAHTVQEHHRCVAVEVPAAIEPGVAEAAATLARRAAQAYGCVGVVGVEMFERRDGSLLLNEIAPRPHNTGHYTIEACVTSQYENHLRAVLDWPLGSPSMVSPVAVMINVLGRREGMASLRSLPEALAQGEAAVHVYGKHTVRPGRKMGHVTALGDEIDEVRARAQRVAERLEL